MTEGGKRDLGAGLPAVTTNSARIFGEIIMGAAIAWQAANLEYKSLKRK